jgi:hypothetical protein
MVRPSAGFNKNRVKPLGKDGEARVGSDIMCRRPNNSAALGRRNGLGSALARLSRLYLDKGDDTATAHDKIDLPGGCADPAVENALTFQAQRNRRPCFRPTAVPFAIPARIAPVSLDLIDHRTPHVLCGRGRAPLYKRPCGECLWPLRRGRPHRGHSSRQARR